MIQVEAPGTAQVSTLRHGTWHLWGLTAPADATELSVCGPPHLLESMRTVIVPSYWGSARQCRLASALLAAGLNPYILTLADAVLNLDAATVSHSVLVEVEQTRVCVTRLSGDSIDSRMTHLVGAGDGAPLVETVIALAYQLTVYPNSPLSMLDDVEVTGGRGITEYPPRWQEDIEFIVAEVAPGCPRPQRAVLVDRLRDRGFMVFDCPSTRLGERDNPTMIENTDGKGAGESGWPRERVEKDSDCDAVSRVEERPRRSGDAIASVAAVGVLAVVAFIVGILVWLISDGAVNAGERRHEQRPPKALAEAESEKPQLTPPTTTVPQGTSKQAPAPIPTVMLDNAGVAARFPKGWELDPTSPLDRMTVIDGGDMRVLALANPLSQDMTLEHLAAALSSSSADDETKSAPERRQVMGTEVVVMEERPPSGNSIVLWHHKVVNGFQVSVGCQFRGKTIAPVRPVCDEAVASAQPVQ